MFIVDPRAKGVELQRARRAPAAALSLMVMKDVAVDAGDVLRCTADAILDWTVERTLRGSASPSSASRRRRLHDRDYTSSASSSANR